MFDLTNKVAIVTGGSRGIGRSVCVALAQAGAYVVVNFRSGEAAAQETRGTQSDCQTHEQSEGLLGNFPLHHAAPGGERAPFHADGMANEHSECEGESAADDAVARKEQGCAVARAHEVNQEGDENAKHAAPAFTSIGRAKLESA